MRRLTGEDATEILGEALHTAFRKGADSSEAWEIWKIINQMDATEWHQLLLWLVGALEFSGFGFFALHSDEKTETKEKIDGAGK